MLNKKNSFSKYSGCGNDFILLDNRNFDHLQSTLFIKNLCCRKTGLGADGVIFLETSSQADLKMRIFNSDGSEAEMCGNGLRCLARFANDFHHFQNCFTIETQRGNLQVEVKKDTVLVEMPKVKQLLWNIVLEEKWHLHSLDTGVPHAVLFVEDIPSLNVMDLGKTIRYHPFFAPRGTNVTFAKIQSENTIRIRTYERGVEGETKACGTGAAAAALAAAFQFHLQSPITVLTLSDEEIIISFEQTSDGFSKIFMEGTTTHISTIET